MAPDAGAAPGEDNGALNLDIDDRAAGRVGVGRRGHLARRLLTLGIGPSALGLFLGRFAKKFRFGWTTAVLHARGIGGAITSWRRSSRALQKQRRRQLWKPASRVDRHRRATLSITMRIGENPKVSVYQTKFATIQ